MLSSKWTKVFLFIASLAPLAYVVSRAFQNNLTANPIEYITHFTGDWTIRYLMFTLAITPLRNLLNQPKLTRFRRMLGLFAYFYGCLHFLIWSVLDKQLDPHVMWEDILKRWYITVGMAALLGLTPLAITSTAGWVRRLGYKRWQKLHRIVYGCAALGVIHYWLLVKSDIRLPLMYGAILTALLVYRWVVSMRKQPPAPKRVPVGVVR
ncbi:MAG: sulfoxide reductase heme-binding subunit YedZ [Bryobacterales bacterium]|nr:sulfoxide reductase heme-binding subunit YedZ [Bryobacterales bacterium]MBV9399252.1 sulfoxide reductase heme-binding subunit YedZ [Bryobacterales bacterium]